MARRKKGPLVLLILIALLIAIQFYPVNRDNPTVTADFSGDPAVKQILVQSCYDCHSNQTKWPWYSHIAPVSWLVVSDAHEGREKINFSEWGTYSAEDQADAKKEIRKEVEKGEMPLEIYLWMHSKAKLTDLQKADLLRWTQSMPEPPPDTTATNMTDEDED